MLEYVCIYIHTILHTYIRTYAGPEEATYLYGSGGASQHGLWSQYPPVRDSSKALVDQGTMCI